MILLMETGIYRRVQILNNFTRSIGKPWHILKEFLIMMAMNVFLMLLRIGQNFLFQDFYNYFEVIKYEYMKQIILSFALLFTMNSLFSQDVLKLGIVKGKHVTYEVREMKKSKERNTPYYWIVRNMNNPDSVIKPIPLRAIMTPHVKDMQMQVAEIVHGHLSPKELLKLNKKESFFP